MCVPQILLLGMQARSEKIFCRDLRPLPGKALSFVSRQHNIYKETSIFLANGHIQG